MLCKELFVSYYLLHDLSMLIHTHIIKRNNEHVADVSYPFSFHKNYFITCRLLCSAYIACLRPCFIGNMIGCLFWWICDTQKQIDAILDISVTNVMLDNSTLKRFSSCRRHVSSSNCFSSLSLASLRAPVSLAACKEVKLMRDTSYIKKSREN